MRPWCRQTLSCSLVSQKKKRKTPAGVKRGEISQQEINFTSPPWAPLCTAAGAWSKSCVTPAGSSSTGRIMGLLIMLRSGGIIDTGCRNILLKPLKKCVVLCPVSKTGTIVSSPPSSLLSDCQGHNTRLPVFKWATWFASHTRLPHPACSMHTE